jgi:hypothetical protein
VFPLNAKRGVSTYEMLAAQRQQAADAIVLAQKKRAPSNGRPLKQFSYRNAH